MTRPSALIFLLTIAAISTFGQQRLGGLNAQYYNGTNFEYLALTRVDKKIGFSRMLESPCPGVGKEYFSIRWTGTLEIPTTGTYVFHALADDGLRFWVNHQLIIDAWYDQVATPYSASIFLEGGQQYDIRVEYFNSIIHSVLQITWQVPENDASTLPGLPSLSPESPIQARYLKPERTPMKPKLNVMVAGVDDTLKVRRSENKIPKQAPLVEKREVKNVPVSKKEGHDVKSDEPIILKTVVFQQQSAELPSDAFQELNELAAYMRRNPLKKVEIRGHTDYAGDSLDNHHLSEQRAKAVEAYLVKTGVAKERISTKALGGSQPLVRKKDIEDRLMNRRVEFVVTD